MLKRFLSGGIVGLAASLGLASAVQATTVNFNGVTDYTVIANTYKEGGLKFTGYLFYLVTPDQFLTTWPSEIGSTLLATWIEPMVLTLDTGGSFDLNSVSADLGWYNVEYIDQNPAFTDVQYLVGQKANCVVTISETCTVTAHFDVGYDLQKHVLEGFTGLSSVTFQTMTLQNAPDPDINGGHIPYTGFVGYDDFVYTANDTSGGPVPEPSAWAMMIVGFGGVGALMRRRGRQTAIKTA